MKCQKCQKNEATIFYKENINGKQKTLHLCQACAKTESPSIASVFSDNLFSSFGNFSSASQSPLFEPNTKTTTCPSCGLSLEELYRSGRVGCADCYTAFEDILEPYIKKTHGVSKHIATHSNSEDKSVNSIEILQKQLNEAIASEDYESAARLRDEIRRLEEDENEFI